MRNIPVEFNNGDIAFRRGSGVASQAVLRSNTRGSFSHVGIVMEVDKEWMVVHTVPYEGESRKDDKIYMERVGDFFNTLKASSGAIYRYERLDSLGWLSIRKYLEGELARDTPFDHDYDLADSSKLYCSELVWRSYLRAGVDVTRGARTKVTMPGFAGTHIMPADIETNEELTIVYRF